MSTTASHVTAEELAALNKPKKDARFYLSKTGIFLGMTFIVLYCTLPFYWMIVSSLRLPTEGRDTSLWPDPPSLLNYVAVFQPQLGQLRRAKRSCWRT